MQIQFLAVTIVSFIFLFSIMYLCLKYMNSKINKWPNSAHSSTTPKLESSQALNTVWNSKVLIDNPVESILECIEEANEYNYPVPTKEAIELAKVEIENLAVKILNKVCIGAVITQQGGIEIVGFVQNNLGRYVVRINQDGTVVRYSDTLKDHLYKVEV